MLSKKERLTAIADFLKNCSSIKNYSVKIKFQNAHMSIKRARFSVQASNLVVSSDSFEFVNIPIPAIYSIKDGAFITIVVKPISKELYEIPMKHIYCPSCGRYSEVI